MKSLIKQNTYVLFHRQHDRLPALDGIRAIAIIMVVGVHFVFLQGTLSENPHSSYDTNSYIEQLMGSRVARIFLRGEFGVDLFFVLSGFLIGSILLKELFETKTLNLKRFYTRRFIRLIPVYFFVLFAGYLVYALTLPSVLEGKSFWTIMANVVYINNFLPIEDVYMIWCWSLAIEEQFYTICPLLLLLVFRYAKSTSMKLVNIGVIIAILVMARGIVLSHLSLSAPVTDLVMADSETFLYWDEVYVKPHTRMSALLIGVLCALVYLRFGDRIKQVADRWWFQATQLGALFIMGWLATDWLYTTHRTYIFDLPEWARFTYLVGFHDLFAIATAVVFLGVLSDRGIVNRLVGGFLSMRFWYPIAQLSYSWYLVHMILMEVMYPHTSQWFYDSFGLKTGFWLNGIVASLAGLFVSYLLFIFIEKPSMDIRRSERIKRFHG